MNVFEFTCFLYLRQTLKDFSEDFSNDFLLEDFPLSLQEVFRSLLPKLVQILDRYFMCVYIVDSKKL